jgi:hypothetical protein
VDYQLAVRHPKRQRRGRSPRATARRYRGRLVSEAAAQTDAHLSASLLATFATRDALGHFGRISPERSMANAASSEDEVTSARERFNLALAGLAHSPSMRRIVTSGVQTAGRPSSAPPCHVKLPNIAHSAPRPATAGSRLPSISEHAASRGQVGSAQDGMVAASACKDAGHTACRGVSDTARAGPKPQERQVAQRASDPAAGISAPPKPPHALTKGGIKPCSVSAVEMHGPTATTSREGVSSVGALATDAICSTLDSAGGRSDKHARPGNLNGDIAGSHGVSASKYALRAIHRAQGGCLQSAQSAQCVAWGASATEAPQPLSCPALGSPCSAATAGAPAWPGTLGATAHEETQLARRWSDGGAVATADRDLTRGHSMADDRHGMLGGEGPGRRSDELGCPLDLLLAEVRKNLAQESFVAQVRSPPHRLMRAALVIHIIGC